MIWAWEVDGLNSTTKMVLVSLAQHANEDGRNSFPSVRLIGEECRMSERTVQGALKTLEAEGYISVERRMRQTSVFTMRMDLKVVAKRAAKVNPAESAPSSDPAEFAPTNPAIFADSTPQLLQDNPAEVAPEPVLQPVKNQPVDARAQGAGGQPPPHDPFDRFTPPTSADPAVYFVLDHDEYAMRDQAYRDDLARWQALQNSCDFALAKGWPATPVPPKPTRPVVPWIEKRRAAGEAAQQPAPPGWKLPFNRDPQRINYAPIPPEPAGDPKAWMPRLSHPEHKWAILAPSAEIDPHSMNGGRHQYRGGWYLRGLAAVVAEAIGVTDMSQFVDWRPLCGWLDDGLDPYDTILPTIRRVMERRPAGGVGSLAYFDRAVRDAAAGGRAGR